MKRTVVTFAILAVTAPAFAGVVYQVESRDLTSSPPTTSDGTMSVEGGNLKVQIANVGDGRNGEMIFRGDRREMVMVNHDDKSYFVMDEATMRQLAEQIGQAMAAMEQALAAVPESQRKKMEEMMKSRMPMPAAQREPSELKKTGGSDAVNGFACDLWEVWRAGAREREMCVTDWGNVEGSAEVAEAFRGMSAFMSEMLDSLPDIAGVKGLADESFAYLAEIDGFPVVTRELAADGSVESETTFVSSRQVELSAADFEPPKGYKRQDLMKQMRQ